MVLERNTHADAVCGLRSLEQESWHKQIGELPRLKAFDWLRDAAPPEAHQDKELILAAVIACGAAAMRLAAQHLRCDPKFVLDAVALNGFVLGFAAPELRADRDFVLAAVSRDGDALDEVALELRADREVVRAAVSQKGLALRFAAPELQSDAELLAAAVVQDPSVLKSTACCCNNSVIMEAAEYNGLALKRDPSLFQADCDVVMASDAWEQNAMEMMLRMLDFA